MGQEFSDATSRLGGQPLQDISQVGIGLMPVQFGGLDQAHDSGSPLASPQAAGEQPIVATQGNRANAILDPIIVDGDLPLAEVIGQLSAGDA